MCNGVGGVWTVLTKFWDGWINFIFIHCGREGTTKYSPILSSDKGVSTWPAWQFLYLLFLYGLSLKVSNWLIYWLLTVVLSPNLSNYVFWAWLSSATLRFFSLAELCHTHEFLKWLKYENTSAYSGPCHQHCKRLAEKCHTHILRGLSLSWSWSVGQLVGWSLGHTLADLYSIKPHSPIWSRMVLYGPLWYPLVL